TTPVISARKKLAALRPARLRRDTAARSAPRAAGAARTTGPSTEGANLRPRGEPSRAWVAAGGLVSSTSVSSRKQRYRAVPHGEPWGTDGAGSLRPGALPLAPEALDLPRQAVQPVLQRLEAVFQVARLTREQPARAGRRPVGVVAALVGPQVGQ